MVANPRAEGAPTSTERLDAYLALIERERESRPAEAMLADEIVRLRRFGQALFVGLTSCWNGDCDHESVHVQQKDALHDWKYEVLHGDT